MTSDQAKTTHLQTACECKNEYMVTLAPFWRSTDIVVAFPLRIRAIGLHWTLIWYGAIFFVPAAFLSGQSIGSGTLNVVLANKNGCVIAADSRSTDSTTHLPRDDAQKLFRISD